MSVASPSNPILTLLELIRRVRKASSVAEQRFILVNDTHALVPYRQAALWVNGHGVQALSGVVQPEANAPYVLWLSKVCEHLAAHEQQAKQVSANDLPEALALEWSEWLPASVLWLPMRAAKLNKQLGSGPQAALLLARDDGFEAQETSLLAEWCDAWVHAWSAMRPAQAWWLWRAWWRGDQAKPRPGSPERSDTTDDLKPWWRRPWVWAVALTLLVAVFPVKLSVLSPAELVPANPDVIRAPLEGVIGSFHVQPNQRVKQGQLLFVFDEALIRSKLDVARQAMATAESEYRQSAQQALTDPRSKATLALITGKIEEKRAEVSYITDQLARARVFAPRDGVVLFDDPTEWTGKPVAVGERIMRVAATDDVEVEVWIGLADAIPLPPDAGVALYLNASPLSPVKAQLRYLAHDAVQRPDGSFAYRLRATLVEPTDHRVGLKGTARVEGQRVPLIYWVVRRPLASIRAMLGW